MEYNADPAHTSCIMLTASPLADPSGDSAYRVSFMISKYEDDKILFANADTEWTTEESRSAVGQRVMIVEEYLFESCMSNKPHGQFSQVRTTDASHTVRAETNDH